MSKTKPTYHIGLCMAGAISAGAYTAGVMDYLFEALDNWEKAKRGELPGVDKNSVPQHDVIIDVMGGASAGGITSGLGALAAYTNFKPVTLGLPAAEKIKTQQANLFYNTWVNLTEKEGNDMFTQILNPEDLLGGNIYSLLNAGFIEEIAANTVKPIQNDNNNGDSENNNFKRGYINDEMQLIVTLTNLNGIPYQINFLSDSTNQNPQYVYNYRDFGHFILNPSDMYVFKPKCTF